MELGLYTFADVDPNAPDKGAAAAKRAEELIAEIELADQVGLDVFGLGEHHRPDYMASSPATLLAAAAVKTKNIRLTSAVSVLSSDDPVRVFQQYATVDLLSKGRAEIMAGRGSFIESFPLFGYDLDDYDKLFEEKLDLLMKLRDNEKVSWSGETRAPLSGLAVYPRPLQNPLPLWIAVGGTPNSVARRLITGCRWRSPSSAESRIALRRCSSFIARRRSAWGVIRRRLRLPSTSTVLLPRRPSLPPSSFTSRRRR